MSRDDIEDPFPGMPNYKRPEYGIWEGIKERCYNPNSTSFRWYGARGISMCERWRNSFVDFFADIGFRPAPHLQLDRIDNNGDYEPGNVRWATAQEQALNRRQENRFNRKQKLYCKRGHLLEGDNVRYSKFGATLRRKCRTCTNKQSAAKYHERNPDARYYKPRSKE